MFLRGIRFDPPRAGMTATRIPPSLRFATPESCHDGGTMLHSRATSTRSARFRVPARAPGITDVLVADLESHRHDVVICNFANADMVGHTGNLDATISAVETLDGCLGRILTALSAASGTAIVTADHGNAEQMWDDELQAPHTAHTRNPVPVILVGERYVGRRLRNGSLRDVAPTMLELLEVAGTPEMTGVSLLER